MSEKYKTLGELQAAYQAGELQPDDDLVLDNDTASVYVTTDEWETSERVFTMHPDEILWQALDLLGIPHDHV